MPVTAPEYAAIIFEAARPVIRIHRLTDDRWKRGVAKGGRIGPWYSSEYEILDQATWKDKKPCLYLVAGARDQGLRYVGISRNRMADRWRESPAFDAITMAKLPKNQLFHSQCWRHIEREHGTDLRQGYEVRCIDAAGILPVVTRHGPPLSAVLMHGDDGEGVVAGVERWMCNQRVVQWNVSMTG